jgi:hypothetical protein
MTNYALGIVTGTTLTLAVLSAVLIKLVYQSPLTLHVVLDRLIRCINRTYRAAEITGRVPYHVMEGRVLVNNDPVVFYNQGRLCRATIDSYLRDPAKGNYYLVTSDNQKWWIPDIHVWEPIEVENRLLRWFRFRIKFKLRGETCQT